MTWLGSYEPNSTFSFLFTTRQFSSGAPFLLSDTGVPTIAVYKPTSATQDTGATSLTTNFDSKTGLNLVTINTGDAASAASFYDTGGVFDVIIHTGTVDSVSVANEVIARFKLEWGVNVDSIDGDTGPADNLGRIVADTGTGSYLYRHRDTGGIADAIWTKDVRALTAFAFDTGIWGSNFSGGRQLTSFAFDTGIWGSNVARSLTVFAHDTGIWGSNFSGGRTLTQLGALDTGLAGVVSDSVWDEKDTGHADTGTYGRLRVGVNVKKIDGDTGPADNLGRLAADTGKGSYLRDTGGVATAVWAKDVRSLTAFAHDTGIWGSNYTSGRTLTQLGALDTGLSGVVSDAVWDEKDTGHADTGTYGRLRVGVSVGKLRGDTGAANVLSRMYADTGTGALFPTVIADTLLDRNMATGTDSEAFNNRTPRGALSALRNRVEADTGTLVVYKEDDTTPRWTATTEQDTGSDGIKTIDPASA